MGLYITSVYEDCVINNDSILFTLLKHDSTECKIYLKESLIVTISTGKAEYTQEEKATAIRSITEAFTSIKKHILTRKKSTSIELPNKVFISVNRENNKDN